MSCFIIGEMTGLTNTQLLQYSDASRVFLRVKAFNQNIRSKRIAGNKTLSYYIFADYAEKNAYRIGQFTLTQNDPNGAAGGLYNDVDEI
jgi:hypothetical protein